MHNLQPHLFEERRDYPRVVMKSSALVCHKETRVKARIHDLSVDGLQVHTDRINFQKIHPTGRFIRRDNAPVVDVSFHLNIRGKKTRLNAKCLMYYFVVLPAAKERDIAFGLRFIAPGQDLVKLINAYILHAMRPDDEVDRQILTEPKSVNDINIQPELGSYDMKMELLNLLRANNVEMPDSRESNHHQCLIAAVHTLFDKNEEMENRIYRLEQKIRNA